MKNDAYSFWKNLENICLKQQKNNHCKVVYSNAYLDIFFQTNVNKELQIFIHFNTAITPIDIDLMGIKVSTQTLNNIDRFNKTIVIENKNVKDSNIFKAFSASLLDNLESCNSSDECFEIIKKVITNYKNYFANMFMKSLSLEEQQGLYGELQFIKYYAEKNEVDVVEFWEGTKMNKHDFVFSDHSVEVKTTRNQTRLNIRISNENQLSIPEGKLYLKVYRLEQVEAGESIYDMYRSILPLLSNDKQEIFEAKLINAGVDITGNSIYYNFRLVEEHMYEIDDKFPKITKNNLHDRVFQVKYYINLDGMKECIYE